MCVPFVCSFYLNFLKQTPFGTPVTFNLKSLLQMRATLGMGNGRFCTFLCCSLSLHFLIETVLALLLLLISKFHFKLGPHGDMDVNWLGHIPLHLLVTPLGGFSYKIISRVETSTIILISAGCSMRSKNSKQNERK